ncbi:hypothetical protein BKA57DRAFT_450588 [Linnemannia elongata]|nr:hypothetical protein BKA57DRAFT_450588 [Linnemannia elongata]
MERNIRERSSFVFPLWTSLPYLFPLTQLILAPALVTFSNSSLLWVNFSLYHLLLITSSPGRFVSLFLFFPLLFFYLLRLFPHLTNGQVAKTQ